MSKSTKIIGSTCLCLLMGCATVSQLPVGFAWGNDTSKWANDGDCDDPRFDGEMAHSILLAEDAYHDASDCRKLYQSGRIALRDDYKEGARYNNPIYAGQ
ncbi:hypothetical protein [Halocynthiibacter namhaensis]|uniref:hypothetical protein n=1 Tax=Halocynthiibacter namhaensis TaxID=1290553 RepID=UPI0012E018C8|nr:hypothetical protein [Halocynthiibacter namhaensis]